MVVLLGLGTGSRWVALLLGVAWMLLLFCRRYTRSAKGVIVTKWREGRSGPPADSGFRYYLCDAGILYLIPAGIAIACYVLLAGYVSLFSGSLSIGQLIGLQQFFERVSGFFSDHLKLSGPQVFGLLILTYLLSSFLLAGRRPGKVRVGMGKALYWLVDLYSKGSGVISTALATLAALTLFGMHLGVPSTDLGLRIKIHQEGYAEVAKTVDAKMSQQVAGMLYGKVVNAFPQDYRDAMARLNVIDTLANQLGSQAGTAREKNGVSDSAIDRTVQDETSRMRQVTNLPAELTVSAPKEATAPPAEVTLDQIDAAKVASASVKPEPATEIIHEGERKIVLHVEKLFTEQVANVLKPVTDAIPILQPVVQSVVKAATDKSLQDRFERAYNRVLTFLLHRPPSDADAAVKQEAATVVAETDVSGPVGEATPQATSLANALRAKEAALNADSARLGHQVDQKLDAVVTGLVNRLGGTNLSDIEDAMAELRKLGPSLGDSQVQKLVSAMRNGSSEAIRHNAAIVVGKLRSEHVTSSLRVEAKSICGCP
ncbi:hypothetical protein ACFWY9_41610 [Amycolatopsis sp. NPDC059027]|uniref:hypothetical protein n=1 Tax=unclassified Amycolatopsis TaxID=2618356 RepID=UPI0036708FA0